jgi:3-hydroxybutyryl-CoA dehydrogenase
MTIQRVSILGSGTMGIDIALLFAQHGFDVILWHKDSSATAHQRLIGKLDRYVAKEVFSAEISLVLRKAIGTTDDLVLAAAADLVVESVVEDYATKTALLCRVCGLMRTGSLLVTNTSSFSIDRLGEALRNKRNFAGLHFFNPATKMELIEIVAGKNTSAETIEQLRMLAVKLGKISVTVKDTPGFIVNRLLMIQINSAICLLDSGAASAEDIDLAMTAGLGHKKGPLALADFIGLDVVYSILTSIYKATNDSAYNPSGLLAKMISEQKLGRKSGAGFFIY